MINYDGRTFASLRNSGTGEVGAETRFHYHQNEKLVWAEYAGGGITLGHLVAVCADDGSLDMRYHHVNASGELMTGICISTPQILTDGRLRLHEKWQWTSGDQSSGESIIEESFLDLSESV